MCLQNINDGIQHGRKDGGQRQIDDPDIGVNVFHQCERDQQRDEIDGHQQQVTRAGFKGFQSLLNVGHLGQSAADVQVTQQDEQERQPKDKHRVQTADHIIGEMVVAGQAVYLPVVAEIAVNDHRLTEGKSGDETDGDEHGDYNEGPERGDERHHEPVGHPHLVVQRVDDGHQPVVGQGHQVERLHGQTGVAEEEEGQALVVGDVRVVEQEDVEELWNQSRVPEQVHKGQVKNSHVFGRPQVAIQTYHSHDGRISEHRNDIHKEEEDVIKFDVGDACQPADDEIWRTHEGDVFPRSRVEKLHCQISAGVENVSPRSPLSRPCHTLPLCSSSSHI